MSGGKSKPDMHQAIEYGTARFSEVVKIQEGKTKLKIASWNMNNLDKAKATKQLIEAVCDIITREEFDLLALQEIIHRVVPDRICTKLNAGDGTQWDYEVSWPAGRGYQQKKEYFAFLYKKKYIKCTAAYLINFNIKVPKFQITPDDGAHKINISVQMRAENNFIRKPFWGLFQINGHEFSLINVHLKANGANGTSYPEREAKCLKALGDLVDFGTNVIILGDFNLHPDNAAMGGFRTGYKQGPGGVFMGQLYLNEGQDILVHDQSEDEGDDEPLDEAEEGDSIVNNEDDEEQENEEGHVINIISDHRPVHVTLSLTGEIEHV